MSKPKRLSRQERAFQWRRDHVLESAERVFARKGFHEATMQEIAKEAEYATGTLYGFLHRNGSAKGIRAWTSNTAAHLNDHWHGKRDCSLVQAVPP